MKRALLFLLLASSAAVADPGYIRTQVPGKDLCIYWDVRKFTYQLDAAGYSQDPSQHVPAAVDAAFRTWQTLSDICSGFQFISGPRITNPTVGFHQGDVNTNVLTFREANCEVDVPTDDPCMNNNTCANKYKCWDHGDIVIALTTATFNTTTGVILDADIEFNGAPASDGSAFLFTTVAAPQCSADQISTNCVAQDVQNTLTHEIGHVIGLDHVTVDGATMEASAPLGETRKRIIDNGTGEGFCDIYPRAQASSPTCILDASVHKDIIATNRGSSIFGGSGCATTTGAASGTSLLMLLGLFLGLRGQRKKS